MATSESVDRLRACASWLPPVVSSGAEGLIAVATHPAVDILICGSSGTAGLEAVLAAIEAGKTIALANKEVLVMAGELDRRRKRSVSLNENFPWCFPASCPSSHLGEELKGPFTGAKIR